MHIQSPADVLDYIVDFADLLDAGDLPLGNVAFFSGPDGLTIANHGVGDGLAAPVSSLVFTASGGTEGTLYTVTCKCSTSRVAPQVPRLVRIVQILIGGIGLG